MKRMIAVSVAALAMMLMSGCDDDNCCEKGGCKGFDYSVCDWYRPTCPLPPPNASFNPDGEGPAADGGLPDVGNFPLDGGSDASGSDGGSSTGSPDSGVPGSGCSVQECSKNKGIGCCVSECVKTQPAHCECVSLCKEAIR